MDEEIKNKLNSLKKTIILAGFDLTDPYFNLDLGLASINIFTTRIGVPANMDPEDKILNHKIVYVYGNHMTEDIYGLDRNGEMSIDELIDFLRHVRRINKLKALL